MSDLLDEFEAELPSPEVQLTECPVPGIYTVPEAEYRLWDAANVSLLKIISDFSPFHADYARRHPKPPTPAMRIGTALHALLLDGEPKYLADFPVLGQCVATKKTDSERCSHNGIVLRDNQPYCGVHDPQKGAPCDVVAWSPAQDQLVRAMAESLLRPASIREFITAPGANEVSIVWDDSRTGVRCKARLDMLRDGKIGDLKTAADASKAAFTKTLGDYRYDMQAQFYMDGVFQCAEATGKPVDVETFRFFAVEKKPPYSAAFYNYAPVAQESQIIDAELQRCLRIWKNCTETGVWYGYSGEFVPIAPTPWRIKELASKPK